MTNNKDAFLESIKGVEPIKKNNTIKKPNPKHALFQETKKNLTNEKSIDIKSIVLEPHKNTPSFKLQKSSMNKKLKKGKIPIDKKIDFHGLSVLDSEILFSETVKFCYHKNLRCLLFITGKGILKSTNYEKSENKLYYGKIRNSFFSWVKKEELQKFILSFEQASMEYGADGAFFVYLRKKKLISN